MPFWIGAVSVAGLVAGLYVWPPNWSFPQLGGWFGQTATSAVWEPVIVLVVETPENVEVMRTAVHPDRSWKPLTLLAVVLMPPGWSYYIVLGPLASLTLAWRYVDDPSTRSAASTSTM